MITWAYWAYLSIAAAIAAGVALAAEGGPDGAAAQAATGGHHAASGPAATAPAPVGEGASSAWSRPLALSRGGDAIGSPGGTHPLVTDGKNVHVVWWQGGSIHYRRSADGGANWADDRQVVTGGTAVYPCSLELSGKTLHLIWPDSRNGGKWEVYYKRSDDGGATWGAESRLTTGVDLFRMGTAVSGQAVHVVWFQKGLLEKVPVTETQSWTWTWGEVYYKRSADGGTTWDKDVRLTQPDNTACRPSVAADGKYVHVCWLDRRDLKGEHPWQWKIWYKRSDDGGATWGPDVRMSGSAAHARHPQIVITPGGGVCLIWEDGQVWEGGLKWSGDAGMWAAVSKDNGLTWTKPRRITFANTPHGHATHAKAYAFGRRIHLTWTDALPGAATAAEPIRAEAPWYTTSPDGGATWQPAELIPAGGPHGVGEACAAAGTEAWAIELLGQGGTMSVTTRP